MNNETDNQIHVDNAIKLFLQLRNAINSMPYSKIIEVIEYVPEIFKDDRVNTEESTTDCPNIYPKIVHNGDLTQQINKLKNLGENADFESISKLVNIANEISSIVSKWADPIKMENLFFDGPVLDGIRKQDISPQREPIKWEQDFRIATRALSEYDWTILQKIIDEFIYPLDIIFDYKYDILLPKDKDHLYREDQELLSQLTDMLISVRIEEERASCLHKIAANMFSWPTSITAIADNRQKRLDSYLDSIRLGQGLGIKLSPNSFGKPRDTSSGTSYNLALDCYNMLENERQYPYSEETLIRYREDENAEEGIIKQPAGRRSTFRESIDKSEGATEMLAGWTIHNIWKRKAALLPPLTTETAGDWADASLAYLSNPDAFNFDKPFKWPTEINNRAKVKNVSLETAARETLVRRFKHLAEK